MSHLPHDPPAPSPQHLASPRKKKNLPNEPNPISRPPLLTLAQVVLNGQREHWQEEDDAAHGPGSGAQWLQRGPQRP